MAVNVTQKDKTLNDVIELAAQIRPLEDIPLLINNRRKEQVEYLRELVHDINESLECYGSDIPENKKD